MKPSTLAALVLLFSSCPEAGFGAPCDVDADCADGFVCQDDVCVPEGDGEGEGQPGEGEGEGEAGEGEGEGNVDHLQISALPEISALGMDARGTLIAAAVDHVANEVTGRRELRLYLFRDGTLAHDVLIESDIGQAYSFAAVGIDANEDVTIAYVDHTDGTAAELHVAVFSAAGTEVLAPLTLGSAGSFGSTRADIAIGNDGLAVLAYKLTDDSVHLALAPTFSPILIEPSGANASEYARVGVAADPTGDIHVIHVGAFAPLVHSVYSGTTSQLAVFDTTTEPVNYVTAAYASDGILYASFDVHPGLDLFQCLSAWGGQIWGECEPLPVDFNTHSNSMVALDNGDIAIAFADASAGAPVLFTRHESVDDVRVLDLGTTDISTTNAARLGDGSVVVSYIVQGDPDIARLALVRDP